MTNSADKRFKLNETSRLKSAASCRACGTHITFKRLESGKSVAVEDDSNIHRCDQWKSWSADHG
jgi:hypothetical protein